MASDVVYDATRAYLAGAWVDTTIQWENENFEPPFSGWIAMEMSGTLYSQASIGADVQAENRGDEEGTLWLHCFAPKGTGTSTLRRWAKKLADLFRGARLLNDELEFMDAQIGLGDSGDDDGAAYRITVVIDWRRMES